MKKKRGRKRLIQKKMQNKFNLLRKYYSYEFLIASILMVIILIPIIFSISSAYGPEIKKDSYIISRSNVDREISEGDIIIDYFDIQNLNSQQLSFSVLVDDSLSSIIELDNPEVVILPKNFSRVNFIIKGKGIGSYSGNIKLQGDINEIIPVNISVINESLAPPILLEIGLLKNTFAIDSFIEFKLDINKINPIAIKDASFSYIIMDAKNSSYLLGNEEKDIDNSFQESKKFYFTKNLKEGIYTLQVFLTYNNRTLSDNSPFMLKRSFFNSLILGVIPMWLLFIVFIIFITAISVFYFVRRGIRKKKKYQMKFDVNTIPKKNNDFLFLGNVAETSILAYLEPNKLTTHTIVAGATGGGKSISAQVLIEEALMKNIAVIVFDPTAQWSGMLRKCGDKKMLSFYPKFGLKESDARAFKGNVRQVRNSRELIEINKYMNPGQIQIFSLNKLDPSEMDIFVANVIRQIFKSDLKESPDLKLLFVFDEVHRLLAKFGGSGEGFLQVERACREVRKWGIGVMLISQVLSDFVGEIKANINTEVQMRTLEESDLERIRAKYGEEFLKSLVKSEVGVAMFQNAEYNRGRPYFINFRPILHNTWRLLDEELEKYNKYNDIVDELDYQIAELEKEKVDIFDLKMELKLVKDKLMTGSFLVVEIYLEGLKPRIDKGWEKLGKKPSKREIKLVDESEIKKSIEEAKKAREKFEAEEAKKQKETSKAEDVSPESASPEAKPASLKKEEKVQEPKTEEKSNNSASTNNENKPVINPETDIAKSQNLNDPIKK